MVTKLSTLSIVLVCVLQSGCLSQPPAPVIDRGNSAPPPRTANDAGQARPEPAESQPGEVRKGIPLPDGTSSAPAAQPQPTASSATLALLRDSEGARGAGDDARAVQIIERGLRIEQNNPQLWLELAQIHWDNGRAAQAEQCARKALQFAGRGSAVGDRAQQIISKATAGGRG